MENNYCLTCGIEEGQEVRLQSEIVGHTVSRTMLKDRQHFLKEGETITLCEECAEELRL